MKKTIVCHSKFLPKFHAFCRDQVGRYQARSYGEPKISISRKNFTKSISLSSRSIPMGRTKSIKKHSKECYGARKCFIEIFFEEIKSLVMGELSR